MALCTICQGVVCSVYSKRPPNNISQRSDYKRVYEKSVERWYHFPASTDCQLCSLMEAEISKESLEYGQARISFNASSSVFKGWIGGVQAFAFPVQITGLGDDDRHGRRYCHCENGGMCRKGSVHYRLLSSSQVVYTSTHTRPRRISHQKTTGADQERLVSQLISPQDGASLPPDPVNDTRLGPQIPPPPYPIPSKLRGNQVTARLNDPDDGITASQYRKRVKEIKRRVDIALTWIENCHSEHHMCNHRIENVSGFSPTRLIDVGGRLIETQQHAGPFKYATLTHCWGPSMPESGMTKTKTLLARRENIDFSTLPKSFRDALLVAKSLGIPYMWIDSLCIIQDSKDDWEAESAKMGHIYSNAWCTIAASSAKHCHEGIPFTRQDPSVPCEFSLRGDKGLQFHISISPSPPTWESFYSSNPLNKRGWTFQERELSPRILHFSADQMWWECRNSRNQEDPILEHDHIKDPAAVKREKQRARPKIGREEDYTRTVYGAPAMNPAVQLRCLDNMLVVRTPVMRPSILHKVAITEAAYNTWYRVIEDYTKRTFTRITDRFPALSGLASEMQAKYGDEYIAGAWRQDVLRSLLWRRAAGTINSPALPTRRPLDYRAPSWSWAAIDEAVSYDLLSINRVQLDHLASTTAHIEEVSVDPIGSDPKGQLKAGFIRIRGKFKLHKPSKIAERMTFHFDFDDEILETPVYLLSLFGIYVYNSLSLKGTNWAWALALVMVEEAPIPIFRRVGVVSDVYVEWFDDATDISIKIV